MVSLSTAYEVVVNMLTTAKAGANAMNWLIQEDSQTNKPEKKKRGKVLSAKQLHDSVKTD
jgi:hypothetical protein